MKRNIDQIIVHCAATPPDMDIGAKEIDHWHRGNGWLGIGYHYVIRRDGEVESGRSLERAGAHASGYNANTIGICLVGGVLRKNGKLIPENNFTPEQFEALATLIEQCREIAGKPLEVLGHRDLPGVVKACPSFDVREWLKNR